MKSSTSTRENTEVASGGDFAHAGVRIALTPGRFTSPKGMAIYESISNWTPTKYKAEAVAWEQKIVPTALEQLKQMARAPADELLAQTADVRHAADQYLQFIDNNVSVKGTIATLLQSVTPDELKEAQRLSRTVGLICLPEREWYDLLSLIIVHHAEEVEGERMRFWGKCPNEVRELYSRFQLLASRLYPERGWELLDD